MKQVSTKATSRYQYTQFGAAYRNLHTPAFSAICNLGIVLSVIALIGYIRSWFDGTLSWETPFRIVLTVLVSFIVLLGIGANVGTWMMKKARNDSNFQIGSILFAAFFGGFSLSCVVLIVALNVLLNGWLFELLYLGFAAIIAAVVGMVVKKVTANVGYTCYVSFVIFGSLLNLRFLIAFSYLWDSLVSMLGIGTSILALTVCIVGFLLLLVFPRVFQYAMFFTYRLQNKECKYFPPCNPPTVSLIVLGSVICAAVYGVFMMHAVDGTLTFLSGLLMIFTSVVYLWYFISLFRFFKQLHSEIAAEK